MIFYRKMAMRGFSKICNEREEMKKSMVLYPELWTVTVVTFTAVSFAVMYVSTSVAEPCHFA
jgi:hypothetical protein